MKLTITILIFILSFSAQAQLDTLKKQEIRFALLGKNDFPLIHDKRIKEIKTIFNPTLTYLKQKNHPSYI